MTKDDAPYLLAAGLFACLGVLLFMLTQWWLFPAVGLGLCVYLMFRHSRVAVKRQQARKAAGNGDDDDPYCIL